MTDSQLREAWRIFGQASELPREQWQSFVGESCKDPEVGAAVLGMLEHSADDPEEAHEPAVTPDRIGSQVGPFRITGFLGRGGMGAVYSARDMTLGRAVALKILKTNPAEGEAAVRRHVREAKAASSLNHPNIVSVYQVVETATDLAIAMELIEGNSLRQMAGKPLPLEHVCHFGSQAALALAAAHRQGIIHRDIKPENLMVRPDGYVKVVDFGIAKEIASDSMGPGTAAGLGTLRYMSPEQTSGTPLTGATDVFSLGLVLYELATGRYPFDGRSPYDVVQAIVNSVPAAPSSLNPFLPAAFDGLIFRMLDKTPAARPAPQEVASELNRIVRGEPGPAVAAQPAAAPARGRNRKAMMLAAGAIAVCGLAGGVWWRQAAVPARVAGPVEAKEVMVPAAGPDSPAPARFIYGIKPDGELLAYVDESGDEGGTARWKAQAVSAPGLPGVNFASFARVLAGGDGVLYGIAPDGTVTYFRLVDPWRNRGPLRWSPDSNTVIGKVPAGLSQMAALSRPVWVPAGAGRGQERVTETAVIRGGWIWAVTKDGSTAMFQHGWKDGGGPSELMDVSRWHGKPLGPDEEPRLRGPQLPPGEKCPECKLLEGGAGIFYAVRRDGRLIRYRQRADSGDWVKAKGKAARSEYGVEVGHDWGIFQTIVSEPGEYRIEGYVSTERRRDGGVRASMSVEPGATVSVRASTFSPSYSVRLLRLVRRQGDSGLIDGVAVGDPRTVKAADGGNFKKAQSMGMNRSGAGWSSDGADLILPRQAPSGIYAAELTTPDGGRYLAPFVVKPRNGRRNRIALIANANTWNAFNQWGGGSRLASFQESAAGQALELSYERPLTDTPVFGGMSADFGLTGRGPRDFNQLVRAEVWMASTLDQLARADGKYPFDVFSDLDLDEGIENLNAYRALILQTLPQFWTDRMRDRLEAYLGAGGHVLYLGSHGLAERVSISAAGHLSFRKGPGAGCTGRVGRTTENSLPQCPAIDLFREPSAGWSDGRSERAVLGLAFELAGPPMDFAGKSHFVVQAPHPFLTGGTGLAAGSKFGTMRGVNGNLTAVDGGINGYYSLGHCPETPGSRCAASHTTLAGAQIAFSAPGSDPPISPSSIVYRRTAGGGWVFSIGSASIGGALAVDPVMQRILRNALDSALEGTSPDEK